MQKHLFTMLVIGTFLLTGAGCSPSNPSVDSTTVDETEPVSVVGTWTLTFWDERSPDTPISTTGTFFADGTAKTNYPAHYTIDGDQITVTADNGTTTSVGTIENSNMISGTWEYPEKGTQGIWKAERLF